MHSSVLDPPHISPAMNPAQQHAPSSKELHLAALEQALANSEAREIETQKTLELLTNSLQLLQDLVLLKHLPLHTPPKVPLADTIPIYSALISQTLSPALPDEFDRD